MQEMFRCKACGYLMKTGRVPDQCPACGVPKTAFERHKLNISEKRKKILDMHIHQIVLHFPQSFIVFGFLLMLLLPIFKEPMNSLLMSTAKVVFVLLPFTVVLSFLSGMNDGKVRFKKITTPILKKKIIIGSAFILISVLCAFLVLTNPIVGTTHVLLLILSLLGTLCATVLGIMGSTMLDAKLPG